MRMRGAVGAIKRTMKVGTAAAAAVLLSSCTLLGLNHDGDPLQATGDPITMTADLTGKDDMASEVPVQIAGDRKSAVVDVDGVKRSLTWVGDTPSCPCRSYADDDYALSVHFPTKGDETGEATLTYFAGDDEQLSVDGVLQDESGLKIKIVILVASDQETATFHHEGEAETLAWTKQKHDCQCRSFANERFEAMVYFDDHDSTVKRKKS